VGEQASEHESEPVSDPSRAHPAGDTAGDTEPPVLPDITTDERRVGWGDEDDERDADWYRRERPPHHE
jgi:hypothetical protein